MNLHVLKKWFTLVELIVVITILWILAVLSYPKITSYLKDWRDTVRQQDISNLNNILERSIIENRNGGAYPLPGNYVTVVDNGNTLWYQGVLDEVVLAKVIDKTRLPKAPRDPSTGNFYTYSVTSDFKKYQVTANFENTDRQITLGNNAYAANSIAFSKWTFDPNGDYTITQTGSRYLMYKLPSIIVDTSLTSGTVDLATYTGSFVVTGSQGQAINYNSVEVTGLIYNPLGTTSNLLPGGTPVGLDTGLEVLNSMVTNFLETPTSLRVLLPKLGVASLIQQANKSLTSGKNTLNSAIDLIP